MAPHDQATHYQCSYRLAHAAVSDLPHSRNIRGRATFGFPVI